MSEVLVNKLNPQDFYTEINKIVKELKVIPEKNVKI